MRSSEMGIKNLEDFKDAVADLDDYADADELVLLFMQSRFASFAEQTGSTSDIPALLAGLIGQILKEYREEQNCESH
jgi:hypothetical protein